MVECDVCKNEVDVEEASNIRFNINDIVGQISDFVGNIRGATSGGEPMGINIESFSIAVSKDKGKYELALKLNLAIKPKTIVMVPDV